MAFSYQPSAFGYQLLAWKSATCNPNYNNQPSTCPVLWSGYTRVIIPLMSKAPVLSRRLYWLMTLLGILLLFQLSAAARALQVPPELAVQVSLPMPLQFVAGILWAVASLVILVRLWQRRPGSAQIAGWLIIAFCIYSLLRLLLFTQADYDRGRLPFLMVLTIIILLLPVIGLIRRTRVRLLDGEPT